MARRSKMAKDYNWPKRVVLQRFHDDFYRHFEDYLFTKSKASFYTNLAQPLTICCSAKFISTPLIRRASKVRCLPNVWPEPDGSCTLYLDGSQN